MKKLLFLCLFSLFFTPCFSQNTTIPEALQKWIIEESQNSGSLDFFTTIKGTENELIQTNLGDFTTNKGLALVNWGTALKEAGVVSVKDALHLYKLIKKSELDETEINNITKGFK